MLAIDSRILRLLVGPDITIVPGRAMMARVVAAGPGPRGSLSIAGYLLEAELPAGVRPGQDLRLVVRDVSSERILLGVGDEHEAAEQPAPDPAAAQRPAAAPVDPPPVAAIPLPGGGSIELTEREAGGGGGRGSSAQTVALRYHAPALGTIDLRLALDPATLQVAVAVARGEPYTRAQAAAGELRQALTQELQRPASVAVTPRHEPLDVYA